MSKCLIGTLLVFHAWKQISQVFLYVHKIRGEMVEKENEEKEKNELEENFNDLVKQLL